MPRICPEQLLNCLKVLLAPNGGIKSEEQIDRLVSLIQKFSTKLVSKCIYISILKATDVKLINEFMGAGGWKLLYSWLDSSVQAKNWPLTVELLELLQLVPVDLERLKSNTIPKLVKNLTKQHENEASRLIASDLIAKWATIIKTYAATAFASTSSAVKEENETTIPIKTEIKANVRSETKADIKPEIKTEVKTEVKVEVKTETPDQAKLRSCPGTSHPASVSEAPLPVPKLKISLKDVPKVSQLKKENEINDNSDDSYENDDIICNGDIDDSDDSKKLTKREKMQRKYKDIKEDVQERMRKLDKYIKMSKINEKENSSSSTAKPTNLKVKTKDVKTKPDKPSEKKLKDLKPKEKISDKDPTRTVKDKVQAEKDKANLAKALPTATTVLKLGKIPKKVVQGSDNKPVSTSSVNSSVSSSNSVKSKVLSDDKDKFKNPVSEKPIPRKPVVIESPKVVKKVSISIEPKRSLPEDAKVKTVKTFNSKFRLTGLEEEPPKPPITKKLSNVNLAASSSTPSTLSGSSASSSPVSSGEKKPSQKRQSPPKEQPPPEKKSKTESPSTSPALNDKKKVKTEDMKEEKKPLSSRKPMLLESVGFMDALDAANVKPEPRKRKRKLSMTKETNGAPEAKKEASPTNVSGDSESPTKVPTSPPIIKPFKFYQDTMETSFEEESKSKESIEAHPPKQDVKDDFNTDAQSDKSSSEEEFKVNITENEVPLGDAKPELPKSALVHFKSKKDSKRKSVSWKEEECLISVKYFELDETERINVTKNFLDMKQQERCSERENFLKARNLPSEDVMEEKVPWRVPPPIDLESSAIIPGKNSQEKEIQYAREKTCLQAIYFNRRLIPDSPAEPDLEIHATTDPTMIPLDDTTGSTDSVFDFTLEAWPEPKGEEFDMSVRNMMMPNNNFMFPGMANSGFPCGPFPPGNMFTGAPNPMAPGDWRGPDPSMGMFPGNRPGPMGPGPMGPMGPGGPGPGPMGPGGPGPGPMGPGGPGPGPMGPVGPMGPMGMGPGPDMGFPGNFDPSFGPGMGPGSGPPNMFNGPRPGPGWFDPSGNNVGPPQQMMNMNSDFGSSGPGNMPPRNSGKNRNEDRSSNSGGRGDGGRPWKGKDKNKSKGKGPFKGKSDYNEEFALRHGICKMFLRKGTCPFSNCKFLHSMPP